MPRDPSSDLDRLGVYVLPGRVTDPSAAIGQARTAEHLGLGAVWLGERYGSKDLGVIAGAMGQATSSVRIGSGITHFLVRHPMVVASMAMTMQAMTGRPFVLGVGRSVGPLWTAFGLPGMTNQILADSADIVRRLCRGEKVKYDGPAGRYPSLKLSDLSGQAPPMIVLAAIGPKSLALAGAQFDGAMLHPFLTVETVARSAEIVRKAAVAAGRDPSEVKVYATVVVAPDLTEAQEEAVVGGRAVTYFQIPAFGDRLAATNGWDPAALEQLRSHPKLANVRGSADNLFTRAELTEVSRLLPREWLETGAAVGSASTCAARVRAYLDAGADELILHGSTAELLGPLVQHFREGTDAVTASAG
jgi:5,10-methylenetetrahydromethanopterin reductase